MYNIIDRHTGMIIGKPVKSLRAALRKVDRLDNAYGAYRYYHKKIG